MSTAVNLIQILMADDDPDDRLLAEKAFRDSKLINQISFVEDGQELMEYLRHEGAYTDPDSSPRPGVILLDLNMPRKDGREALSEIKSDPDLKSIPIIVLTTSKADEDVLRSYELGANSFITKPVTFKSLAEAMRVFGEYWFEIVKLPE